MHMGTSYLVGDLALRINELEAQLAGVGRDTVRIDWLEDTERCYWVALQMQPHGNHIYQSCGSGLREAIDSVTSAGSE